MLSRIGLLCLSFILSSCLSPQPSAIIDWLDLIRLDGVTYFSDSQFAAQNRHVDADSEIYPDDVLTEYDSIKHFVPSEQPGLGYQIKDGDSTRHEAGTVVSSIAAYSPKFRLLVKHEGVYLLYEAAKNINAETGADLLDIEGKVIRIELTELNQEGSNAVVNDMEDIESLVSSILNAPIDNDFVSCSDEIRVEFVLQDSTSSTQELCLTTGLSRTGIQWPLSTIEMISGYLRE